MQELSTLSKVKIYFLLIVCTAMAAQEPKIADLGVSELIDFLTYRTDRADRNPMDLAVFRCGQEVASLEAATALRNHGANAIPQIELEIAGMLSSTSGKPGWYWIIGAYVSIQGKQVLPMLREVEERVRHGGPAYAFEDAIATSLNITSYVSATRPIGRNIRCTGGSPLREALDRVILGTLRRNRSWLESGVALNQHGAANVSRDRIFEDEKMESWFAQPMVNIQAVGYRLEGNDSWSAAPLFLLARTSKEIKPGPSLDTERISRSTQFYNREGAVCGEVTISFRRTTQGDAFPRFVLERDRIQDIVQIVVKCAA